MNGEGENENNDVGNDGSSLRIKIKFDRNKSITSIKKESDKNEVPSKKKWKVE